MASPMYIVVIEQVPGDYGAVGGNGQRRFDYSVKTKSYGHFILILKNYIDLKKKNLDDVLVTRYIVMNEQLPA